MISFEKRRTNTRTEIIKHATKLFIEDGYTRTSINKIAKDLELSPGNITFYFHSKDHLLAVLVDELCDFQHKIMTEATEEGKTSLMAYCLEIIAIAAICEEDEVAKDFYVSAYTSPLTLDIMRKNDTKKAKEIFGNYCTDWSDLKWRETENLVSGIEYATVMTREVDIPLDIQIESALNAIMLLYGVPEDIRRAKLKKVLAMDYRAIGRRILKEFKKYIEETNEMN